MVAVALGLAFGVGVLVGESCQDPIDDAETPECTPTVVERERVVYRCEPDVGQPDAGSTKSAAGDQDVVKPKVVQKGLPPAPPPITPKQRKQLLAWVRDQSRDLDGCRSAAKDTYRLTVTLELGDDGKVRRARFNASELPANVAGCLRQRMMGWEPPGDLVKDRPQLVFGLTL